MYVFVALITPMMLCDHHQQPSADRTFIILKRNSVPTKQSFFIPLLLPAPGNLYSNFSLPILSNSWVEACGVCPFVSGLFRLAACFRGSSVLQPESERPPFPRLNDISQYAHSTFCLVVCLSMDARVISTFWLLWMLLLWTLAYEYLFESLLSVILGNTESLGSCL